MCEEAKSIKFGCLLAPVCFPFCPFTFQPYMFYCIRSSFICLPPTFLSHWIKIHANPPNKMENWREIGMFSPSEMFFFSLFVVPPLQFWRVLSQTSVSLSLWCIYRALPTFYSLNISNFLTHMLLISPPLPFPFFFNCAWLISTCLSILITLPHPAVLSLHNWNNKFSRWCLSSNLPEIAPAKLPFRAASSLFCQWDTRRT